MMCGCPSQRGNLLCVPPERLDTHGWDRAARSLEWKHGRLAVDAGRTRGRSLVLAQPQLQEGVTCRRALPANKNSGQAR